jgi:hypothetical protein
MWRFGVTTTRMQAAEDNDGILWIIEPSGRLRLHSRFAV